MKHTYEPGREHYTPEGKRVIATETELLYIEDDGTITRRPNEVMRQFEIRIPPQHWKELFGHLKSRPSRLASGSDEQVVDAYIAHAGLSLHSAQEARSTYAVYQEIIGKPFAKATREDGRRLARHLIEVLGNRSATVEKKVGWLRAAVNMAVEDQRLSFNPFQKVVPRLDDGLQKLPLSEEDMVTARSNLDHLSASDQLLWKLLATTGMRLSEPFQITEEFAEKHGRETIRYVIVGTKSDSSERRVPLPTALLPELPKKIERTLFEDGSKASGKRLMRFIRAIGIKDPRKTTHCLRHRAKDRLRVLSCPVDVQYAILGHEKKTVAASYGEGYPCGMLLKWLDRIGW
jgi:integrase